ncbi:MAG TPA: glycosyltransferase family 9 protein [Candidatus Binatia bacterium]|nr:glycosyltransferase family 9 protein [Candidatus Binatia bacterium]
MRKILVVAMAGIGDTLLATPLIHELRQQLPRAQIDVAVMWPDARDFLQTNPHISNLHYQHLITAGPWANMRFLRGLGRVSYEAIINTYPQSRIAYRIVERVINAPIRISHAYDNVSPLDRLLVNRTIPQDYNIHVVENNMNLLRLIGLKSVLHEHDIEIFFTEEESKWAEAQVRPGEKIMGIHVGSGKTKNLRFKRWPIENYVALIPRLIQHDPRLRVQLFGGPAEKEDHERIMAQAKSERVELAPSKSLRQAAALIRKCDMFLSVDSALMHLAAAGKVPQQFVIESPAFNKTGEPYRQKYTLIRNPVVNGRNLDYYRYDGKGIKGTDEELLRCMRSITVDMVYDAIAGSR